MKTKREQKLLCGVGALAVCCMLTGCHMSHEWQEATCITPRTCLTGGETEGEALGHTWVEATCAEPKHCSVCGETEGEPLEHTWAEATCMETKHCSVCGAEGEPLGHTLKEANYQQAATCEVCGETVGEPLEACFEKDNIICDAELNKTYSEITTCYDNPDYTTTLKVTFSDYKTFASDDTHEALEGYEWKTIAITVVVNDDNARNYGYVSYLWTYDYYDDEFVGERGENHTINYNGVDYSECFFDYEGENNGWIGGTVTINYIYTFRVPEGYDGLVVGTCSDATKTDEDGEIIRDINFRLQ